MSSPAPVPDFALSQARRVLRAARLLERRAARGASARWNQLKFLLQGQVFPSSLVRSSPEATLAASLSLLADLHTAAVGFTGHGWPFLSFRYFLYNCYADG